MALFAIWHDEASHEAPAALHKRLRDTAHIVPERTTERAIDTPVGRFHLAAFATASAFYSADAQVWEDGAGGFCLIHGLIWQRARGVARLLDAAGVAALLDRPGRRLPGDVAGEYAVARLHPCGTLEAFGDPAGLHALFHRADRRAAIASRAAFLAAMAGEQRAEAEAGLWLAAIGYRVGTITGWRGVEQLAQGARIVATGPRLRIDPSPVPLLPPERGFANGGAALIEEGIGQAKAAIRLAAGEGALDLPITGGKDSRVVLAIALAAGLRDRLTLFTRGYVGHPDVIAGAGIAAAIGVPHRREAPLGADGPADLSGDAFLRLLGTIAYQADGGMGGWDNVTGHEPGQASLVTGHMGELLKAYAKRPAGAGALDPVKMVKLQAPFDPMGLIRPGARNVLIGRLAAQMAQARLGGAREGDQPDLFYWRNRIPNWLGGIRGIKSFERQPVLPLGVPALMALAFRMTPEERKAELAHFRLIERAAPELLALPFAHQRWDDSLAGASARPPIVAGGGMALFGSWQWSLNRNPAVRARLRGMFAAADVPLWEDVDRAALLAMLHDRRFDYFDAISLMGIAAAVLHQSGVVLARKLGGQEPQEWSGPASPAKAVADRREDDPVAVAGHLDAVTGAAQVAGGTIVAAAAGEVRLQGWLQAPEWPGATVAIEARADGRVIGIGAAEDMRGDLAAARIGDGRYGFALTFDAAALAGADELTLTALGSDEGPKGGRLRIG